MKITKLVKMVALLAGMTLNVTAMAQEPEVYQLHMADHFGLNIGMPEQDMLNTLGSLGFVFNDQGEYERVKGSKEYAPMLDYMLVVHKAAGAEGIWNAGNVLLGVKDGALAAIGEFDSHDRFVGQEIYLEQEVNLAELLGESHGILANYDPRKSDEYDEVTRFYGFIWNMQEKPPSDADPETAVWFNDNVMTILAMRFDQELDERVDRYHRSVMLWNLDFCAFDVLQKFYPKKNRPVNCKK